MLTKGQDYQEIFSATSDMKVEKEICFVHFLNMNILNNFRLLIIERNLRSSATCLGMKLHLESGSLTLVGCVFHRK